MSKAEEQMGKLLGTSAKQVLAEFFRERLDDTTHSFLKCNKETFEVQKGRAIELQSLLDMCTK